MNFSKLAVTLSLSCGLALPALLTGCGVTTQRSRLAAPLTAGESPVAISITNNTREIHAFDEIKVKNLGTNELHTLWRIKGIPSMDTSLYMDVLPAAEYQVVALVDSTTRRRVNLNEGASLFGNFRVKGGGPVDLGRLVITPLNSKVLVGRSNKVSNNSTLIRGYTPYADQFDKEAAGGWLDPRNPDDHVEEYAMSKPVELSCFVEKDNAFVMASGRMGVLMLRHAKGNWSTLQSKNLAALNCATPVDLPAYDLLVTGEFGTLLGHVKGSGELRHISTGNLPFGDLWRIVGSEKHGWYIAIYNGDSMALFHSPVLENGNWTEVRREAADKFWMWPTANGLAYTTGTKTIEMLDFSSGKWSSYAVPEGKVFSFRISPTGMMAIEKWRSRYVSYDAGQHWEEVKIVLPAGASPSGGMQQMSDGSLVVMASVRPGFGSALYRSIDKGKTWELLNGFSSEYDVHALKSIPLLQVERAYRSPYMTVGSSFDGKNWRLEYTNFNLAEYERSKKSGSK